MPLFKDRSGQLWEYDNPDDATRQGMVQASDADIDAHNLALDDPGLLGSASRGLQAGLGHIQDIARDTGLSAPMAGGEAFGPGGMAPPTMLGEPQLQAPTPPAGVETFPGGFDEQARAARELHPIAFGAGMGAASAPFAAIAGAAGGAVGGPAILGAGLLGVGAEAGVEGAFQEYSDAYFEQRPFELKNVAANTLMFSGLDFAFRGALKGIGSAFTGKPATKGAVGSRNVVSEAQGAARELGVEPVGGSVGAARAADLEEPFVDAIKQMSDRDAAVLARDADDHLHLISQDASEAFTRLNNGLSDDLGSQLKYEDIGTYAQELDPKTLERQSEWWTTVSEDADAAARRINALADGDTTALDFGNLGKKATQTIDDFNRRISETVDPGQRMIVIDEFKKRLDKLTMSIDGSYGVDNVTRSELKAAIAPTRETLRKGLENKKLFGGAADLQRSLNSPWHGLLEHWSKVQNTLTETTGHVKFDQAGAGRITRESTVDRMLSLLGKDPRSNQEFGRHLAGTLENIQGLIDARQAYGIARKDGLDALESDIRNLMEDWNLAQTVGVAKNRTAALKRDPRKWATLALNLGERLPMVGQPIQLARTLGDAFTDLHISQKTSLGRVWDTAYKRYAGNTAFQDPAVIGSYSPWVADALKSRGGKFMPPAPPAGAVGSPAMPGMPPANANAQRSVAQPQLSPAAQGALERSRARASQSGHVSIGQGVSRDPYESLLEQQRELAEELSPAEKKALRRYTFDTFAETNKIERGESPSGYRDELAFAEAYKELPHLRSAMSKLRSAVDAPLYHGGNDAHGLLDRLQVGSDFEPGFTLSSSLSEGTARGFSRVGKDKPFVLRFPEGSRKAVPVLDDLSATPGAKEVLIPRDAKFTVAARSTDADGRVVVDLVPADAQALARSQARASQGGSVTIGGGWRTGNANVDAGLEKRLTSVLEQAQKSGEPLTAAHLADRAGLRHKADWEVAELEKQGLIRRVTGDERPKGGSVEIHYVPTRAPAAGRSPGFTGPATMPKGSESKYGADARDIADTVLDGKSLRDLGASSDSLRPESLERLRSDEHFRTFGAVIDQSGKADEGLVLGLYPEGPKLTNGRHRLLAARENGIEAVQGTIRKYGPRGGVTWEYRGPIRVGSDGAAPAARGGERGFVDMAAGLATSPLGGGTAAAGALGARYAMGQEPEPPPQQAPEHAYRDALREIEQAGQSQVRALASDALRAKPRGKDRDPLSLFAGKRRLQDAVEETRERLDEIAADPSTLLQQLGDSAGDLGKTHPSVYMAMTEKAAQVAAYLQAVIPARTATTLLDPVGAAPSFDRAWDYAARFVGATQPRVALREAIRGGAPPEMLEAVQETWPELWSAFQVETLGQVQRMHAAGRHIPSEKLRRLDSLLGLGGQLDPSASLEVTQHMLAAQDAELAKRQEAGQATGAMPSSGPAAASFRTRLSAISAERQMSP